MRGGLRAGRAGSESGACRGCEMFSNIAFGRGDGRAPGADDVPAVGQNAPMGWIALEPKRAFAVQILCWLLNCVSDWMKMRGVKKYTPV